jgi:hypothetical protein
MTTNLCKYHVVSDGGKMAGKCAFVTILSIKPGFYHFVWLLTCHNSVTNLAEINCDNSDYIGLHSKTRLR